MILNKKLNSIVTKLFVRGRKLNISLVFITQSYFKVPKDVRLNTSHFLIAKIRNKTELQQIAINHSSDINTKDFANIYRKCTAEPYSFLVNDTTLPLNNPLRLRKSLFNIYIIKIMTVNDQIKYGKLQYGINREAAKISALPSGKIYKYEYLNGEDILPSNQQQITEQATFTYSLLEKAFEKQIKTIKDQGKKQVDALENLKPKEEKKRIEDKSINKSRSVIIFNEIINKRKELMSELYDSIDYNNLKFEYVGSTNDVRFYEYKDSRDFFNAIKNNQSKFSQKKNKENEFLNKLSNIKRGKKTPEQRELIDNLKRFYSSREEVINFF